MLQLSREILRNEINDLQYKGYEIDTFFNKDSEFHNDAVDEVRYWLTYRLRDALLDASSIQLDTNEAGMLLWKLIYDNIDAQVEKEVDEVLNPFV